jgi:hypothetical protein
MPGRASTSTALPLAHFALRLLIVLNWMMAAMILVLLLFAPTREWIMQSLHLSPSPDTDRVVLGLRAIAVLGLVTVPLNYVGLTRLVAMVDTVRQGEPFVAANAARLQTIAWVLLILQLVGFVIGAIGDAVSAIAPNVDIDAGFSLTGWLAVLLTFLLARVFAEGTRMRDDLEGVV